MKCPQCGIHYDDGDKECPMCGARRPLFAKPANAPAAKTTAVLAKSTAGYKKKHKKSAKDPEDWSTASYETTTCAHLNPDTCYHNGNKHTQSAAYSTPKPKKQKKEKKKRSPIAVIITVIILFNLLPVILGLAGDLIYSMTDGISSIVHELDFSSEPDPDPYMQGGMTADDRLLEHLPLTLSSDSTGCVLQLNSDQTFSLTGPDITESGTFFTTYPEELSFDNLFPDDEQFMHLVAVLSADSSETIGHDDYMGASEGLRMVSLLFDLDSGVVITDDPLDELFWVSDDLYGVESTGMLPPAEEMPM